MDLTSLNGQIDEFWQMVLSKNIDTYSIGRDAWHDFEQQNSDYRKLMLQRFSKKFQAEYNKVCFHDYPIVDINYLPSLRGTIIEMTLYDYYEEHGKDLYFIIRYSDVKKARINTHHPPRNLLWGWDIFELLDNNYKKHMLVLADCSTLEFTFKTISIRKEHRKPKS